MIDSNDALILALRAARLSRSIPMGSIDSNDARILAVRAARPSTASLHFDFIRFLFRHFFRQSKSSRTFTNTSSSFAAFTFPTE